MEISIRANGKKISVKVKKIEKSSYITVVLSNTLNILIKTKRLLAKFYISSKDLMQHLLIPGSSSSERPDEELYEEELYEPVV